MYAWRDFALDLERGCLLRGGLDVKLRPKSFQVLTHLVERHGCLVEKEELIRAVWPDTFVSEDSLAKCLGDIRRAFGKDSEGFLKTVPRRGYIFDGPVEKQGFDAPDRHPHNLPSQATTFVGRAAELADVLKLLQEARLVTLTGAGGCGKTRLALEAAARLIAAFPDGVWLTELGDLTEERLVVVSVAASMGLRPDPAQPMPQRLTQYLRTRTALLVLDNCEHLLAPCAELAEALLRSCPGVRLLATSREPLRIAGERAFRVPSLTLPRDAAPVDEIARTEAVTLMLERTRLALPSFELTAANAPGVAHICRRLDGIPLAIELAAARTRVLSIDQIASRLDDRFRLLVGGSRTAPPRQQTLHAAVEWSHELLTEAEKQLFRRLSVFAGGFTLGTAAEVCDEASSELELLQGVSGLVDKSLVLADEDPESGRRFRMLETIREYSSELLSASGEQPRLRGRHLACFRRLAAVARRELVGPKQSAWLRRLELEHDNFRAALGWCESSPERTEAGLELCAGLHMFWFKHGHFFEGQRWLHGMLAAPASGAADAKDVRAECWFSLGLSTILTGNPEAGGRYLETSLELAREVGDENLVSGVLRMMVHGLLEAGQIAAAEAVAAQLVAAATQPTASYSKAVALGTAGMLHRAKGECDRAADLFREEMAAWRALGDGWMLAASAADAAEAELERGNASLARSMTLEMLALADTDAAPTFAWHLEILGRALAAEGHALTAARVWGTAEAVYERIGLKPPGYMAPAYEGALRAARAAVGDAAAFGAAWQEGRRMNPAEAVRMAQLE
jgi:non-specific serine/threonine protein kinase